jgi:hypothetical protein
MYADPPYIYKYPRNSSILFLCFFSSMDSDKKVKSSHCGVRGSCIQKKAGVGGAPSSSSTPMKKSVYPVTPRTSVGPSRVQPTINGRGDAPTSSLTTQTGFPRGPNGRFMPRTSNSHGSSGMHEGNSHENGSGAASLPFHMPTSSSYGNHNGRGGMTNNSSFSYGGDRRPMPFYPGNAPGSRAF